MSVEVMTFVTQGDITYTYEGMYGCVLRSYEKRVNEGDSRIIKTPHSTHIE